MPNNRRPDDDIDTSDERPEQGVEVNFTLDSDSIEAAKKLKRKTFEKLLSKDLEIIKNHNIKNTKD